MTGPAGAGALMRRLAAGHRRKFGIEFILVLLSIIRKLRNEISYENFRPLQ